MYTLAIIPARSGSKGIKNKNIKKINNHTLIEKAYKTAKDSKIFTKIIVSTDSLHYKNILEKKGIKIFSLRSKKHSRDHSTDLDVLKHEIKKYEKIFKIKFSVIALLQPTSPLRKVIDLKKCYNKLKKYKLNAVWTVSKVDKKFDPIKLLQINKNNLRYYSKKGSKFTSRQLLKQYFIRNGVAYFFTRKAILKYNTILPKNCGYILIKRKLINIDNLAEFNEAKEILES